MRAPTPRRLRPLLAAAIVALLAAGLGAVGAHHDRRLLPAATTGEQAMPAFDPGPPVAPVALPLAGCPPPPRPPSTGPAGPPPWRPPVLVPEAALPLPAPPTAASPAAARSVPDPLAGKGMWVWQYRQTEGGDPDAVVSRAVAAGLHQLWVRVGDSRDGFYGADELAALVPRAHRRGLAVIGWGFPFLWDPVADARWSLEALVWRDPGGAGLDGFSADIEGATEGVRLSERRVQVYLGTLGPARTGRPLVGTVYQPSDEVWATYPYAAMAPYVDAFAPMVYWGCTEPGAAAQRALDRLAALRPLHLIGQAYDMADEGGRAGAPDAAEIRRFLDVARRGGAVGASFWVWQSIGADQWTALTGYRWAVRRP